MVVAPGAWDDDDDDSDDDETEIVKIPLNTSNLPGERGSILPNLSFQNVLLG